ncbi:MAG: glycosyltransferase family 2 protein [Gaiellaceae bacterium]
MAVDVSVLIVTYQCREAARECLESVYSRTNGVAFEVVVVDNASDDGTADMVRAGFPQARLLALDENLGFAAGANLAAEDAAGEYLLHLNPDTVVHDGAVHDFVAFARRRPEHGLYGGRTLRPDGTLDPGSCYAQPTLWSLFCFATMLTSAFKGSPIFDPELLGRWRRDSVREVGIITGCLLLVPRRVWQRLGGFDGRFFMYAEDADLTLRAMHAGYRPVFTPDAEITHAVGASAAQPDRLILLLQGKVTLLRKHWRSPRREAGIAFLLLGAGSRALVARLLAHRGSARLEAWRDVWRARRAWVRGYIDHPPATLGRRASPTVRR